MNKIFVLLLVATVFNSCALISSTQIGVGKEFELGDGLHGAFTAFVKNDGSTSVEVFEQPLGKKPVKIATLVPGDRITARFASDTKAIFKNLGNTQAVLKLKVKGDTGLSMGGPNY